MKRTHQIVVLGISLLLVAQEAFAYSTQSTNQYQPSNYYSEYPDVMLHTSIRPKTQPVQKEKEVEVQRYDENQFRNDPTVLVSTPNPVTVETTWKESPRDEEIERLHKQIEFLEGKLLEKEAKEITGSLADDGKVEY